MLPLLFQALLGKDQSGLELKYFFTSGGSTGLKMARDYLPWEHRTASAIIREKKRKEERKSLDFRVSETCV